MTDCGRAGAALLGLVVLLSGCRSAGSQPHQLHESTASPSTAEASPAQSAHPGEPSEAGNDDSPGSMIPRYDEATSPEAKTGRDIQEQADLLNHLSNSVNNTLKLPHDIQLVGKQCDTANAWWDPGDNSVTLCYEEATEGLEIYTKAGDADPRASTVNGEIATFYHELGHMVISLYDLPITGREEDVADQLSAYILLTPGPDGKVDPANVQAIKDSAREFQGYAEAAGELDDTDLAGGHSPNKVRAFNMECWLYGSNPAANGDLVGDGHLPQSRAELCDDEWDKLSHAWSQLLGPHLK
ncbi:DUF4344 domain-containing metallopeptidase [Mycobacterium sp. SA01]|uniref:DUF4344 domain-containing metallopeptidase n=1 Tax=Mycobacterium sp. SA01 TaxID=3238820 RepID=UPI00351B2277